MEKIQMTQLSLVLKQPPEAIFKKTILKKLEIFSGKYLCWSLFLIKKLIIEKRLKHRRFPVNSVQFLEHSLSMFQKNLFFVYFEKQFETLVLIFRILLLTICKWYMQINRFQSSVTFLHPLKTSENERFSDVFRGYRNVTLD